MHPHQSFRVLRTWWIDYDEMDPVDLFLVT